jgi:hypothetical protein
MTDQEEIEELKAVFLDSDADERVTMFDNLLAKYENLSVQIGSLADVVLELDLRGTEDSGACGVAEIRLREFAETRAKVGELATKLVEAGLVDEGASDGFDLVDAVITKYRALEGERDTLKNLVDEYDGKAAAAALAAAGKAKAVPEKRRNSARKIGPIKLKDKGKAPSAADLLELIQAAEKVEIAFSDGKNELATLAPRRIYGDAWEVRGASLRLRLDKLEVFGPNRDESDIVVDGYGLVLDGELVAYGPRIDKLVLRPGAISDLKDDIVFFT